MCKLRVLLCLVVLLSVVQGYERTFSSCNDFKLMNGKMRMKPKGRLAKFQCNRGFILAGEKYSYCNKGKFDVQPPVCVKPTCAKIKQFTNGLILTLLNGAVVTFYCNPGFTMRGTNTSYCDGTKWSNNLPACISTHLPTPTSCDFETEDLCGWSHDLNHDFDWRRQNFQTPSGHIGTGPTSDHTKGMNQDGYYMYIESTSRLENDTARLISPLFPPYRNGICFKFWYHMFGRDIGKLRIYIRKQSDKVWGTIPLGMKPLWTELGNQGNIWHSGKIVLEEGVKENFQVIIEGVRGKSYVSDIAIDDVELLSTCPDDEDMYAQNYYTSSTDMSTDEEIDYGSCLNRCSENNTDIIISDNGSCECHDACHERNTCCPDYTIVCLIAMLEDTTTEIMDNYFSTDTTEIFETTNIIDTTKMLLPTQRTTTTRPTVTFADEPYDFNPNITSNNTKYINSTGINNNNTVSEKPDIINNNSTVNVKPIVNTVNSTQNNNNNYDSTTQNTPKIIKPVFFNSTTKIDIKPPKSSKNITKSTIKNTTTSTTKSTTTSSTKIPTKTPTKTMKPMPTTPFSIKTKPTKKIPINTTTNNTINNTIKNNTIINKNNSDKILPKVDTTKLTSASNKTRIIENTTPSSIVTTKQSNLQIMTELDVSSEKSQTLEIETDFEYRKTTILPEKPNLLSQKDKMIKDIASKTGPNLTLAIFATCGVAIICIAIAIVIYMKYGIMVNKFRNSSRSDSMSDVRFLASDEVLDFTWKTSTEL